MSKLDLTIELSVGHVEQYIEQASFGTGQKIMDFYRLQLRPSGNDLTAETTTAHHA